MLGQLRSDVSEGYPIDGCPSPALVTCINPQGEKARIFHVDGVFFDMGHGGFCAHETEFKPSAYLLPVQWVFHMFPNATRRHLYAGDYDQDTAIAAVADLVNCEAWKRDPIAPKCDIENRLEGAI